METGVTSLAGFVVRESSINGINSSDQVIEINGEKIGQGHASLSEKILLHANETINITYLRDGNTFYKSVKINEISEYEDVPLGRFNHELNTETKSVRRITSRAMSIAQELPRQPRRSRQRRTLMFTTQE
jgi:predicted HTH domain antitoxin